MRKQSVWKKIIPAALLASTICLTAGCGQSGSDPAPAADADTDASSDVSSQTGDKKEDQTGAADETTKAADLPEGTDKMLGEWELAYTMYHSEYADGETYDYCTMCTDPDSPESSLIVREKDGVLLADYLYSGYETDHRYLGNELSYKKEAAYKGCENGDWCVEFTDPFAKEGENHSRLTMVDDETLIMADSYESEEPETSEYYYSSVNVATYLKKDSPRMQDKENLRYFETVTVSDATELLNHIANNTKIICKAGTYNMTDVKESEVHNDLVEANYGAYTVKGVSNLCIEAEEGAKVLICIDEPYDPVLDFESGSNITLRDITAGHTVEPGYCSGSVLYYNGISGIGVDRCHLYGSGTYGIEANGCSYLDVKDSEIYECTYGLLALYNISTASFKNCVMRDSSEMAMISVDSAYDICFEDCEFKNNKSTFTNDTCFIEQGEYDDVVFKNCSFTGNEYNTFSNREVKMENCKVENNVAKFSDIISTQKVDDASDLITLYEQAKKEQEATDKKLETDTLLDQTTMNQMAYEEYNLWDNLLNRVWNYLSNSLDESTLESLTASQKEWIKNKEAAVKDAGSDFEGGSMQPMVEYSTGADWTRKRVEYLMAKYVSG